MLFVIADVVADVGASEGYGWAMLKRFVRRREGTHFVMVRVSFPNMFIWAAAVASYNSVVLVIFTVDEFGVNIEKYSHPVSILMVLQAQFVPLTPTHHSQTSTP